MRSALEKVTEYRARRGVESANLFPSLVANQSGRGAQTKSGITDVITTSESYKASFDVSWQADLLGKQFQTLKAAKADLEQLGENFYGAQVTLAADVATAYVALRSAEAQLSVIQRSLGTWGETVQLTQWLEQAGAGLHACTATQRRAEQQPARVAFGPHTGFSRFTARGLA